MTTRDILRGPHLRTLLPPAPHLVLIEPLLFIPVTWVYPDTLPARMMVAPA